MLDRIKTLIPQLRAKLLGVFGENPSKLFIVPRRCCLYRCFDLRAIPPQARRQTLQLKISQWSPWTSFKNTIIWQHGYAQVWCWPTDNNLPPKQKWLVETRLFPRGAAAQLLACDQGYEGQYWQQDILKESHWWPSLPDQKAWCDFLRAAGLAPQTEPPLPITQKLAQPWGKSYALDPHVSLLIVESLLWQAMPLLLVTLLTWQGVQILLVKQETQEQRQQQEELSQKIEPILQLRNKMQEDQSYIVQVAKFWQGHRQLQLLNDIVSKLPDPTNMKIMNWEYLPEQLSFTVRTSNTDPSLFVRTYSNLAWGKEVSAQPDSKTGQITVFIRFQADANI